MSAVRDHISRQLPSVEPMLSDFLARFTHLGSVQSEADSAMRGSIAAQSQHLLAAFADRSCGRSNNANVSRFPDLEPNDVGPPVVGAVKLAKRHLAEALENRQAPFEAFLKC